MKFDKLKIGHPGQESRSDHALDMFFEAKNIAIIGATDKEGSVGRSLLRNLIDGPYAGQIYPINPKRPDVFGIKAYPDVASVPEPLDLAVIATPAKTVPGLIQECVDADVKGVIILSAGFKELGPEGAALEQQIKDIIDGTGVRVVGPNCLGLMNPHNGVNATFANGSAAAGSVALISQSGAICTAILDWSRQENVGFSAFVSLGSMLDVGWGDLIDYLGSDPKTSSILIYMESIGDVRSFISAAREVALNKPIVVLKAGRTSEAAAAASSHTGSLVGSDEALDAVFRRCGVLRVDSIAELFYMAETLVKQPRPTGPKLTIITNAGGPAVLATDAIVRAGGELGKLEQSTLEELNEILPPQWSHANPVDILGDASPDRYAKTLAAADRDANTDGLLVVLTPQSMSDPTATAKTLAEYVKNTKKPVLASWMGGIDVSEGERILSAAGVPTFPFPDTAARIFHNMWRYSESLQALYATPLPLRDLPGGLPDREGVSEILGKVQESGRAILTEVESKQVLAKYGIPTVPTVVATTVDDAVSAAEEIGYPIVLKLYSETITHKTDVGGVKLNLLDAEEVRTAFNQIKKSVSERVGAEHFGGVAVQKMIKVEGYELILGCSIDPQIGPLLLFGAGGQLVEVNKDSALGLPPLTTTLAEQLMRQTKIFTALKGVRGRKPCDIQAISELLVRFGQLVAEQPAIREIDINPLIASAETLLALDARIVVSPSGEDRPALAIRPYPVEYITECAIGAEQAVLRPIRPDDETLLAAFHETLSPRSVYMRYFALPRLSRRVAHERLTRMCFIDYDRQVALVAVRKSHKHDGDEIVGVGRLIRLKGRNAAEFALIVSDECQNQGLGTRIMQQVIAVAKSEGIEELFGDILPENDAMKSICTRMGFELTEKESVVRAELDLTK
jgi:acetyltransferase